MSKRLTLAVCLAVVTGFATYTSYADDTTPPPAKEHKHKKHHDADNSGHAEFGTAGCGLGSMIFHDKEGFIQVVAATLNDIGGNQTFGITSGTSNCVETEKGASAALFIEGNKVALQNDMARGNGETLAAFSKVIGCDNADQLGKALQKDYGRIYSGPNSAVEIRNSIFKTISSDQALLQACSTTG
jgi:hypothetical protein